MPDVPRPRREPTVVGICGTPGTGKKTVAPLVAKLLDAPTVLAINSFVTKSGERPDRAEGRGDDDDAIDVDPKALRRALLEALPSRPGAVVHGHLLPHVLLPSEVWFVALLRCEPSVLRDRLRARGYKPGKVAENVEAEFIGVLLVECVARFGGERVYEYDTTKVSSPELALAIARDAKKGATARKEKATDPRWIDWTLDYDSSTKLRSLLS